MFALSGPLTHNTGIVLPQNENDSTDIDVSATKHKIIKKCEIPVCNLHFTHF